MDVDHERAARPERAVDHDGVPVYRIGTTSARTDTLEDCCSFDSVPGRYSVVDARKLGSVRKWKHGLSVAAVDPEAFVKHRVNHAVVIHLK
jgi:hypothetical protein